MKKKVAKKTSKNLSQIKTNLKYKQGTPLLKQIGTPVKPQQSGIQLQIARTARNGNSRQISYTKRRGQFGVYQVQRYSFRQYKGIIYFYGWDIKTRGIKSFILDGISNVVQLNIPHRRLWVVQMGNDPQQEQYWQKQRRKTKEQKAAQKIRQQAKQIGQQQRQDTIQDTQRRRQDALKDMDARQRIRDQAGKYMSRQQILGDTDQIIRDIQDDIQPIIKTIRRNTEQINPNEPPTPGGPQSPFGVV